MNTLFEAVYHDGALRPVNPLALDEGAHVHLALTDAPSLPDVPASLAVDAPIDDDSLPAPYDLFDLNVPSRDAVRLRKAPDLLPDGVGLE